MSDLIARAHAHAQLHPESAAIITHLTDALAISEAQADYYWRIVEGRPYENAATPADFARIVRERLTTNH